MKYTSILSKLGATSYIISDTYANGVRYAARSCDDVALLLNCVGEKGEWLISKEEVKEIKDIIEGEGISLHVHLPTDGNCTTRQSTQQYCENILKAIDRAEPLNAHTFVQHIEVNLGALNIQKSCAQKKFTRKNFIEKVNLPPQKTASIFCTHNIENIKNEQNLLHEEQQLYICEMLEKIAQNLPSPEYLAIENLEGYPLHFLDFCFYNTKYSRCIDIGHLWKDRIKTNEIISTMQRWIKNTRLIHLHGMENLNTTTTIKDHSSLENMPQTYIDSVLHLLWNNNYTGVITLEIYDAHDFAVSSECLWQSYQRFQKIKI